MFKKSYNFPKNTLFLLDLCSKMPSIKTNMKRFCKTMLFVSWQCFFHHHTKSDKLHGSHYSPIPVTECVFSGKCDSGTVSHYIWRRKPHPDPIVDNLIFSKNWRLDQNGVFFVRIRNVQLYQRELVKDIEKIDSKISRNVHKTAFRDDYFLWDF